MTATSTTKPPNDLTQQLLAVQRALDPARHADEIDLLLESAIVVLSEVPIMTHDNLERRIACMWPGARLRAGGVKLAIAAGLSAGLLTRQETLAGEEAVALHPKVRVREADIDRVEEVLAETTEALRHYFEVEAARPIDGDEAEQLTALLTKALSAGIREAFGIFRGEVASLGPHTIIPEEWSQKAIDGCLDGAGVDPSTREILGGLALLAMDPSASFGTAIVTQIATGYVLHAFLARRDQAEDVASAGLLHGITVFLDTPILLVLTGRSVERDRLLSFIDMARAAGIRVIIPEHCIAELRRYLDGLQHSGSPEQINRALGEGADPSVLRQVVDDRAIAAWLAHCENERISWEQYRGVVDQVPERLVERGVNRRALPDARSAKLLYRRFTGIMHQVLVENPRSGQGPEGPRRDALEDDARTLALTVDLRDRDTRTRLWPASWVLTPDKRMREAYCRYNPDDEFPISVGVAQMSALVGTFVASSTAAQLAQAAAQQVSHDTAWRVAQHYPPAEASRLAQALRSDGETSEVGVRLAQQVTLEEVLAGIPDNDQERRAQALGAEVADRRAHRREQQAKLAVARAEREVADAERKRKAAEDARAEAEAVGAEAERLMAESDERNRERERDAFEQARAERNRAARAERAKGLAEFRMRMVAAVAATVIVGVLILSLSDLIRLGLFVLFTAAAFGVEAWRATEPKSVRDLAWTALIPIIGMLFEIYQ